VVICVDQGANNSQNGPADAIDTPSFLASLKSRQV